MTTTGRPSGRTFELGVDDLFFTTTDRLGRIESANAVFLELAQFTLDEAVGAPHNLIRHPDMPAGAFKVMWDLLLAGRPMAAYVKNMARNGDTYWVFATITPYGDGFLSVRTAPCCAGVHEAVSAAYDEVIEIERGARASGLSRIAVAEVGAQALAERVAGLGFATYEAFIRYIVPEEISARAAKATAFRYQSPVGGYLSDLLSGAAQVDAELSALLQRLSGLQSLADGLEGSSAHTQHTVVGLVGATDQAIRAADGVRDTTPVLGRAARGMSVHAVDAAGTLGDLSQELAAVRRGILELRFRIALSRLHSDMVRSFAEEVAHTREAGSEGSASSDLAYIPLLCGALEEAITRLNADMIRLNRVLRTVRLRVDTANEQLRLTQKEIATWRLLIPRYQLSRELDPHLTPIDAQLGDGHRQMAELSALANRCAVEARPFDPTPLQHALGVIRAASEEAAAQV